ncbi:MAG: type 3 domain protein, partial [Acidobacteria bacterium]|nr:type 3 domain protein [Acidobacteriota bacterium]
PAPAGHGLPWWALAAGLAVVAAAAVAAELLTHGDGSPTTLAGSTSTTIATTTVAPTTSAATTTSTFAPTTTTTTTLAPTTTTTTTTTTLPGGGYDQAALDYFREIAGSAEFGDNGGVLHRWSTELRLAVHGDPTGEDRAALAAVLDDLNGIIDTVEMTVVESGPNIDMYFVPVEDFAVIEPNYVEGNMGYVYIWWDANAAIYSGRVLISTTGLTPDERAHLIREELTQGLGLLNDSWLYPESVFYQGWTTTREYAPIDRAVIEMLYRPELSAGMSIDDAAAVLAGLAG